MQQPVLYRINDNHFWLSANRTVFWEEERTLVVADAHIGKTGHFRKSGIAVPQQVYTEDMQRLLADILFFKIEKVILVGDLSHSHSNKEMDLFQRWRLDFSSLTIQLVKGNHDILQDSWYKDCKIEVIDKKLRVGNFSFCHDVKDFIADANDPESYFFAGHLHPAIRVKGLAKQQLRFPCFYFGEDYAILPAFSRFTGAALIEPKEEDNVFAIVENNIIQVQ